MSTSHIKMSYEYGEKIPPNIYTDHDWVREHEHELLEKYGECSILVYKEQIVGVGDTYQAAIADAERRIAPDAGIITPHHVRLFHRHSFFRVLPGHIELPPEDKE